MIQEGMCFPNFFLFGLVDSKKLRYLRLNSYLLLNCKQKELFLLLAKNQSLKILNIAFDEFLSPDLLKQLTEGLKQNVGLEILKVSMTCYDNDSLFQKLVYQLLHSLHHHCGIRTLILEATQRIDIKPVSKLLLYNSKITTVNKERCQFTLDEVKAMVPCLVFNGRRTEFDSFFLWIL